jgi:hypothetical protein
MLKNSRSIGCFEIIERIICKAKYVSLGSIKHLVFPASFGSFPKNHTFFFSALKFFQGNVYFFYVSTQSQKKKNWHGYLTIPETVNLESKNSQKKKNLDELKSVISRKQRETLVSYESATYQKLTLQFWKEK